MPRPRFRLRTLLIAVAVAGAVLGLYRRHDRLRAKAVAYRWSGAWYLRMPANSRRPFVTSLFVAEYPPWPRASWHAAMAEKYERAARYPWLPVEPDPPEPQ